MHIHRDCPVPLDAASWIKNSFEWCLHQFGADALRGAVLLPDAAFFPHQYSETDSDIAEITATVAARMGADPALLGSTAIDSPSSPIRPVTVREVSAESNIVAPAVTESERPVSALSIDEAIASDPVAVTAIVAHQLAQIRLVAERRIEPVRIDRDQLCDLAMIFFGLGVFGANAAASFSHDPSAPLFFNGGWTSRHVGSLGEELFGFGLAVYARLRGEVDPSWSHSLHVNPHAYMKRATRYLQATDPPTPGC